MDFDRYKHGIAIFGLATLTLIWGTQFLVIKHGQLDLPPLLTATLRFAVLTIAAQIAVLVTRSRTSVEDRLQRLSFGLTQAFSFGVLYWAQGRIPSSLAGVLSSAAPLFIALIAHRYVAAERMTYQRTVALTLGFIGVTLICTDVPGERAVSYIAIAAILLGEFAAAVNKVLAKRLTGTTPIPILLRDMGLVVTLSIGLASYCFEQQASKTWTVTSVAAFIYLGLIASYAASTLYLWLLRRYAVTSMAYIQFTTAVVAAIAGVMADSESIGLQPAIGIALVAVGLLCLAKVINRSDNKF